MGRVYHYDLYGKREWKYDFLRNNSVSEIGFEAVDFNSPNYFFNPKDETGRTEYEKGLKVDDIFKHISSGIVTARDSVVIDYESKSLIERMEKFSDESLSDRDIRNWLFPSKKDAKYLAGDSRGWKIAEARNNIRNNDHEKYVKDLNYRPFDFRKVYYSQDMVDWGREASIYHIDRSDNFALLITKAHRDSEFAHIFMTDRISEAIFLSSKTGSNAMNIPLYFYPDTQSELLDEDKPVRMPNLDPEIVADIAQAIGLTFTNEKEDTAGTFAPIDILDYIYAVLHSPTYRETYKEFLKIDFPRVPYPSDADTFWQLVALGSELRQIHLLESPKLAAQTKALGIGYPVGGDNAVTRKMTKTSVGFEPDEVDSSIGKVWLNDTQYFTNVPLVAWEFYIGGYQPAQKWLKDRQGRTLDISDVKHYMNIISALSLTNELMQQIDDINVVG